MESNLQELYPSSKSTVFRASLPNHLRNKEAKNDSVDFKVDREISIVGLEFFGPAEMDFVDYQVHAKICIKGSVSSNLVPSFSGSFCRGNRKGELLPMYSPVAKGCRKGQNFTVPLKYPVDITPRLITQIEFALMGPNTQSLNYVGADDENVSANLSDVSFTFLNSSRQLAAVHFTTK